MSGYCQVGEKAIVTYQFDGGETKTFTTESVPIEISISEIPAEIPPHPFPYGQCPVLYDVYGSYISMCDSKPGCGVLRHWRATRVMGPLSERDFFLREGQGVTIKSRGLSGVEISGTCLYRSYCEKPCSNSNRGHSYKIISVSRIDGLPDDCGEKNPNTCKLEVRHNGIVIFTDEGKCPCTFQVDCDGCPQGTMRCNCPDSEKGYCCLPCAEVENGIAFLTNLVKQLNSF